MRKRFRIVLIVLLLAGLGGLAWGVLRPREPVYQGKPLSSWLRGYDSPRGDGVTPGEADDAVRQIGTNAIPALLRLLRRSDSSPWKRELLDLANKQHFIKIQRVNAWVQNWRAARAFKALGSEGRDGVPELIKLYEDSPSGPSKRYTTYALGNIGPAAQQAIPSLLRALDSSPEPEVKMSAIEALAQIHAEADSFVPALINCLTNNSTEVESEAMDALRRFGIEARPAIPALLEMLESPSAGLRGQITNALKAIDPEAAAKAGVK